jgi:putative transcriptional regulator
MASVHETAKGLHAAGIMYKRTMREFDELCLTPVLPLRPKEIRALRLREGASQAVFARYLNVTTGLVSQWERGEEGAASVAQGAFPGGKEWASSSGMTRASHRSRTLRPRGCDRSGGP